MTEVDDCRERLQAIVSDLDRLHLEGAACYVSMALDALDAQLARAVAEEEAAQKSCGTG